MEKEFAPAPGMAQWENIGPTNIGGRITSLVCDPAKPNRIWAGAAGGGVLEGMAVDSQICGRLLSTHSPLLSGLGGQYE